MSRSHAAKRLGARITRVEHDACGCNRCGGTPVAFCDQCGQGLSQAEARGTHSRARCDRCGVIYTVEFFWTGGWHPSAIFPGPQDSVLWVNGTGTVDLLWGSVHAERRDASWLLQSGRIIHDLHATVHGCRVNAKRHSQRLVVVRYPLAEGHGVEVATSLGPKLRAALSK